MYDLIEIMANLIFLSLREIFSSSCQIIMTMNSKEPKKTFNPVAPEEYKTDAE